MASHRRVLLLAGEESGLLYARQIAAELQRRDPQVEIRGYSDYGFETGDLAVMGFWPVLKRLGYFLRVKRTMLRAIEEWHPDVVCTIDYPGMNLRLAARAKSLGIRVVHVVAPQVWAWKKGRVPKVEAALDRLCCFFPFEPQYFRPGFAIFVGHPLAEAIVPPTASADGGAAEVALLPGSRVGEIEKNLPIMLAAAARIVAQRPELSFTIPAANERARSAIEAVIKVSSPFLPRQLRVVSGGARELLLRATCAAVASGTATLEAALAGCPTVLVYRVSALFAWFARRVIREIHFIGLANIIWEKAGANGEPPMKELLQEKFTVAGLVDELEPLIGSVERRLEARRRLASAMSPLRSSRGAIVSITDTLILDQHF